MSEEFTNEQLIKMNEKLKKEQLIKRYAPEWGGRKCHVCESDIEPVVPMSGLCGPCHFGMADALGGDWWHDTKQELKEGF